MEGRLPARFLAHDTICAVRTSELAHEIIPNYIKVVN